MRVVEIAEVSKTTAQKYIKQAKEEGLIWNEKAMIGHIIITTIGLIALFIGLWTIKEMQHKQTNH
jgi:hypothetical protein